MTSPGAIDVAGVTKSFGPTVVLRDVSLRVEPGSTVALLGPSGCGKTTLLRITAGLERPEAGTVHLDGELVVGEGRFVAPERRHIGMVFQDWALFPHLSVGENVGYGLIETGRRSAERAARVDESLRLVGLEGLGGRMPGTLSGGQQQRVALARAIAPRPRALLFDEPFSNLDAHLRIQIRSEVNQLLGELGIAAVFVTHDQEEAFVLGKEVAVMSGGVIRQQGSPTQVYQEPSDPWVAAFVGDANLVAGIARGSSAETPLGLLPLLRSLEGDVRVLVRPEQVVVEPCRSLGAPGNQSATVVEYYGHDHLIQVRMANGEVISARGPGSPLVRAGDSVVVSVRSTALPAFAASSCVDLDR